MGNRPAVDEIEFDPALSSRVTKGRSCPRKNQLPETEDNGNSVEEPKDVEQSARDVLLRGRDAISKTRAVHDRVLYTYLPGAILYFVTRNIHMQFFFYKERGDIKNEKKRNEKMEEG